MSVRRCAEVDGSGICFIAWVCLLRVQLLQLFVKAASN